MPSVRKTQDSAYLSNMKTIAITIDEPTLKKVDPLATDAQLPFKNRSDVIRRAVEQFVNSLEREAEEQRETEIFQRHKSRLNRQAIALIKEQARHETRRDLLHSGKDSSAGTNVKP